MRSTHWLAFAGSVGLLLGSAGTSALRAGEAAETRVIQLIEESGGTVTREAADKPVTAVSLCGASLSDEVLASLTAFPHLKSLDLCRSDGLTSKRLKVLANLKELESLNISRCPRITGHGLYKLAALKNLRTLDVSHCPEIDDCGLEALADYFPKLQTLNIAGCKNASANGLRELRNLKHLEVLIASDCDLTDPAVAEIAALGTLKSLNLAGNNRVTVTGFKPLAGMQNLEVLDVSNMNSVTSGAMVAIRGLKNLHTLSVANCPRLANHSLKILMNLKQLRSLNLSGCQTLEDYGMEYLVRTLPELRELDLSGCAHIGDTGIRELAKLGQLERLNLRQCTSVSDGAAKGLTDALPKLKLDR
jgi:F-box/leucine-rich repeat protein 14